MRNFWVHASVDGQKTPLVGGPQSKTGGFCLVVHQRDGGKSIVAAKISGFAASDGVLHLTIRAKDGDSLPIVATVETER